MNVDFQRTFCPTKEQQIEFYKKQFELYKYISKQKGCSTCANKKHVVSYPNYVIAEEYKCTVGLECDTVLHSVNNCPKYKGNNADKKFREMIKKLEEGE